MDDLLWPVQTAKKIQTNIDKFESLSLNESSRPNSSKSKRSILDITSPISENTNDSVALRPSTVSSKISLPSKESYKKHKRYDSTAFLQRSYFDKSPPTSLPDDARAILRSQPDREDLVAVFQYLQYGIDGKHDFNVHIAGPQASQIIGTIVMKIVPNYWHLFRPSELSDLDAEAKKLLLSILRSVAGIGALLLQLRQLSTSGPDHNVILRDVALALASVIGYATTLHALLQDTVKLYTKQSMRRAVWQEVVSLLAGSKILSTSAQTLRSLDATDHNGVAFLFDGVQYSQWLARNISACMPKLATSDSEAWNMVSQVAKRGLNLGYRDPFVSELYVTLLLGSKALWTPLHQLLHTLTPSEQCAIFDAMLRDLTRKYLRTDRSINSRMLNGLECDSTIGGIAAMAAGLINGNTVLEDHLVKWLTSTNGEYASLGLGTRRAVIATLALRREKLQHILEKCLETFGDKIQIQHSPILQQETTAEVLLLAFGHLHRLDPKLGQDISKQGVFLQTTSNRLTASVPRARFLGMVVAMAVSRLVDPHDKVMNFDLGDLEDVADQKWFRLVHVHDKIGELQDLKPTKTGESIEPPARPPTQIKPKPQRKTKPAHQPTSKIIAIEEVDEAEASEEEGLIPYQKPDSDPSDTEDDPTLINRSRPSAPIYIVDLIAQLQANDKVDVVDLALKSAPALIRRKADFGTELSENATVVAASLINLRDGMHKPEKNQLRLQALIACLVSQPKVIGPWAVSLYFEGDMSLDQRASLLTMLGLGARELSGYVDDTDSLSQQPTFPSQRLTPHLAAIYSPTATVARQLEQNTIRPLALAAADKLSGPDILKIRTFSSRMEVEKRKEKKQAERTKRIPRDLHKILSEAIYLPLCCRMSLSVSSNIGTGQSNLFEPNLVRLFLQTLTIMLVCLGPNATQLGEVTRETLVLLTVLHNVPKLAIDAVVLPALLQLLLTTLDLNVEAGTTAQERLLTDSGSMIAGLISWAGRLEGTVSIPVSYEPGEGMPWNVLVAGIQVKWHEVGRKYQGRMLGLMGGEMDDF